MAEGRGTRVRPHGWDAGSGAASAAELDAVCAAGRMAAGPGQISLSPASILAAEPVERLVLPSPYGSAICAALADAGAEVGAGSLRNAGAVGRWVAARPGPVGVVAAGERWACDGSRRPTVEDLWGAGAIVDAFLAARPDATASLEAEVGRTAFVCVRDGACMSSPRTSRVRSKASATRSLGTSGDSSNAHVETFVHRWSAHTASLGCGLAQSKASTASADEGSC